MTATLEQTEKKYQVKLPYGLNANGSLVHISEVKSGLDCNCTCPRCDAKLIGKKGSNAHHFAHYSSENCVGSLETALHLLAKEIIETSGTFTIPALWVRFFKDKPPIELGKARKVQIEKVWVETRYKDIQPDLIIQTKNEIFALEVFVTHKVDEEKIKKIKSYQFPAIEIDLSTIERDLSRKNVRDLVIDGVNNKKWLNSIRANKAFERFREIHQKALIQVQRQPISPRRRLSRNFRRL